MAIERVIGIDFGTSTSVIRVKRYQDGRPIGDALEVKQVTFDIGSSMVPTVVQKDASGKSVYFGHDANVRRRGTETLTNFKIKLESPDAEDRRQARELTAEFFAYLAKTYRAQSEGGHLGESSDRERTIVSYPVKWSNETKDFLCETAKAAGFPNVEGLDEASAAIQAVTVQNADNLTKKGYFRAGVPVNILLIDMGAGTTDLVLCRHTPGSKTQTEILNTWPRQGDTLFGGREADALLKGMIIAAMPEDSADLILRKIGDEAYKAWKESVVSPALQRRQRVDYFATLDDFLDALDIDAEYAIDRAGFEKVAADYLHQFPELVEDCLKAAKISGDTVDLVILTGGHSQWYFVREMLLGKMPQFGRVSLSRVQREPDRVIPIALPQETVALGLVYGKLAAVADRPNSSGQVGTIVVPMQNRAAIAASLSFTIGLKKDGTVIAVGRNGDGQCDVGTWRDIVAIEVGRFHTVGLKKDGTVVAVGRNGQGECNVEAWRDVVAIAAGADYTVGLKKDGTVVAVGRNGDGQCDVGTWRDIVAIEVGRFHTVGLKKDGTVVAVGDNVYGQCNVGNWRDIIAIAAHQYHTVGLKKNGTVVAVGSNYDGQCNVGTWRDIAAIAAGSCHTVGLKKNGTVVAVGDNDYGRCDVSRWNNTTTIKTMNAVAKGVFGLPDAVDVVKYFRIWKDIIAIAAGHDHTVGLKKDGTVVAVGNNAYGQCNVETWRLF